MANEQSGERLRVDVEGGKYTYILHMDGTSHALHDDTPWFSSSFAYLPGTGMMLAHALALELDAARAEIARLKAERADAARARIGRLEAALRAAKGAS